MNFIQVIEDYSSWLLIICQITETVLHLFKPGIYIYKSILIYGSSIKLHHVQRTTKLHNSYLIRSWKSSHKVIFLKKLHEKNWVFFSSRLWRFWHLNQYIGYHFFRLGLSSTTFTVHYCNAIFDPRNGLYVKTIFAESAGLQ